MTYRFYIINTAFMSYPVEWLLCYCWTL